MNKSLDKNLNFIKLAFAGFLIVLLGALPIIISQLSSATQNQTVSQASNTTPAMFQSWIISPNGGEVIYGNTEIQFFAKSQNTSSNKFKFEAFLCRKNTQNQSILSCNPTALFSIPASQQVADRDGIRSKFVDFTGYIEANDYKLQLITTDESGQNQVIDYSDNFFTISKNNSKPVFTSNPSSTNIKTDENFNYDIKINDINTYTIVAPNLPSWLTLKQNNLSGKTKTPGIYPVVLVAANSIGRQSVQVFSINVSKVNATPTPTITDTNDSTTDTDTDNITLTAPTGNSFTKTSNTISSNIPDNIKINIKQIVVEISRDGNSWQEIYKGTDTSFNLDVSKFEGGDYYLRFVYEFKDGSSQVKNYGPIHIIKQNEDQKTLNIIIKDITPSEDSQTSETKPRISATFEKPASTTVSTKTFKFELDNTDLTTDTNTLLSILSFSYVPVKDLTYGKHTVKVTIGIENGNNTVKEWSFEIINPNVTNTTTSTKNKIIIGVAIGIIILILILSIWAITLSKKEKQYYTEITMPNPNDPNHP
jgi:hypothetical protein